MMTAVLIETKDFYDDGDIIVYLEKAYLMTSKDEAEAFVKEFDARPKTNPDDNQLFATIVDIIPEDCPEIVPVHENMTPIFLHTAYRDDNVTDRISIDVHLIRCFTVGEVESFRASNIHPSIVFAYDNLDNVEPAVFAPEELDCRGNYWFTSSLENETIYVSFNEDIIKKVESVKV